jgi:protein SCO1/2
MNEMFRRAPAAMLFAALAGCSLRSGLPTYGTVPEFHVTRETGVEFGSSDLTDRVWVADFIFTTCHGPCPRMTSQMRQLADAFRGAENVSFVSFTVDPATDTPEVLKEYAARFKADPKRWAFVTGAKDELQRLSKDTFFLGDVGGPLEHSTRFVLVDKRSRIRGFYDTTDPSALPDLKRHIEELRDEKL